MTYDTINDAKTMQGGGTGTVLAGRYRVLRQLGQGGMGSVWLAEDAQLDGKPFAIKMLPSILVSNKRAYRQLKDEALVAMQLVHPNIVQIRAFEENNGNPFLVMDYIDGQTLDDYLAEKGKLGEEETTRVLRPIAAALDYAHGKGVVHRDVKPGNVMVDRSGTPYILDFGIAREIQETMTRVTGKLSSGTLLYMSPEQLNGDAPKKEQDVYSFAAMVYECFKGEPPFVRGAIEDQIRNKTPEPLGPHIAISGLVMQGLAKRPEDRPKTCAAVLTVASGGSRLRMPPRQSATPAAGNGAQPPNRSVAEFALPIFFIVAAALILGGVAWHREAQRKETARKRAIVLQQAEAERRRDEDERRETEQKTNEMRRKAQAQEDSLRKKKDEPRAAAEEMAKTAMLNVRSEAMSRRLQGMVERISDADGFKARKDALADILNRAEAYSDENVKRWADAEALYRDYVEKSKALVSLDGERQAAIEKRMAAQNAFRAAEAAGAKTHANANWNAAVKTWNAAAAEFGRMDFVAADQTFATAESEFVACATEAKENKRIADERKRRQDEARLAEQQRRSSVAAYQRQPTRTYAYEARIAPYVIENGVKRYVSATFDGAMQGVDVRREVSDGKCCLVLGSNSYPEGLLHLNLRYNNYSAKKWISNSMFNTQVMEVELK